jgi:hypothetical protein
LRREHADRVKEAYALYRDRSDLTHPRSVAATLFRRSYSYETRIRFIGVWDTVGSLGIPLSGLRLVNFFNRRWQFHDTNLSGSVDAAFQALAIDEKRPPFRPAIWTQPPDTDHQQREQVWFAGVHCDVGGGYPDTALAEIALHWMMDRATKCGLAFDAQALAPSSGAASTPDTYVGDPLGQLHESRKGFYKLLRPYVRSIGVTDSAHEYVASSAVRRHDELPAYTPPGLVAYLNHSAHQVCQVSPGTKKELLRSDERRLSAIAIMAEAQKGPVGEAPSGDQSYRVWRWGRPVANIRSIRHLQHLTRPHRPRGGGRAAAATSTPRKIV